MQSMSTDLVNWLPISPGEYVAGSTHLPLLHLLLHALIPTWRDPRTSCTLQHGSGLGRSSGHGSALTIYRRECRGAIASAYQPNILKFLQEKRSIRDFCSSGSDNRRAGFLSATIQWENNRLRLGRNNANRKSRMVRPSCLAFISCSQRIARRRSGLVVIRNLDARILHRPFRSGRETSTLSTGFQFPSQSG